MAGVGGALKGGSLLSHIRFALAPRAALPGGKRPALISNSQSSNELKPFGSPSRRPAMGGCDGDWFVTVLSANVRGGDWIGPN